MTFNKSMNDSSELQKLDDQKGYANKIRLKSLVQRISVKDGSQKQQQSDAALNKGEISASVSMKIPKDQMRLISEEFDYNNQRQSTSNAI